MNVRKISIFFIIILIVSSLIFTGIGNILINRNRKEIVAKIGKEKILLSEYESAYKNELNYIEQALGQPLTNEQIFNVKYTVLQRLIEKKLLFNLVDELNLKIGEESIRKYIKNIKYFQDEQGKFNKYKFIEVLKYANITEDEYLSDVKKTLPITILMNCLFDNLDPSHLPFDDDLINKMFQNRHQHRIVDIIRITPSAVKQIPYPEEDVLQDLYEKHKSNFYAPEYRTIKYAQIEPEHFESKVNVSEEEVNELIEGQRLDDQRDIFNLVFTDHEKALQAEKALQNVNFEEVALEFGEKTLEEIKADNVMQNTLPQDVREEVFALKEGEISNLLQSDFGWHLIKVQSIHKISDQDLVVLKSSLAKEIFKKKSETLMYEVTAEIESYDNLLTIEEISNKYGIDLHIDTIGPVDNNGKDQNGNKPDNLPETDAFIQAVFSINADKTHFFSFATNTNFQTSYFYATVIDITLPKLKSFQESKSLLVKLWHNEFIDQQMYKIASDLGSKLQAGVDISNIEGIEFSKEQIFSRFEIVEDKNLVQPKDLIDEIFTIKEGDLTKPIKDQNDIFIGVLREVQNTNEKADEITIKTIKDELVHNSIDALKGQLIRHLYDKYKVKIDNVKVFSYY